VSATDTTPANANSLRGSEFRRLLGLRLTWAVIGVPALVIGGLAARNGPLIGLCIALFIVAVGLGVGLLLTAVAATNAVTSWNNRHAWFWTGTQGAAPGPATGVAPLWWHPTSDLYDGQTISRFDVAASGLGLDALNRLFSNDLVFLRFVRDLGLRIVDRAPPLKDMLIAEAGGAGSGAPKLLRGLAL